MTILKRSLFTLVWFADWSISMNADPLSKNTTVDVSTMSVEERADLGEKLIFGLKGASRMEFRVGKAQRTLCHAFKNLRWLTPNATPVLPMGRISFITSRNLSSAFSRPEYQQRPTDTEQPEAFPGSGHATTLVEYLAESNICPSCYVIPGFGRRETHDRESPMPWIHRPPISLSLDELIAIDTWLYAHDGKEPPSPTGIKKGYRKFIPESEWDGVNHPPR